MKKYYPIILILAIIISGLLSYHYGVKKTYDGMSKRHTFYATIMKMEEDSFFVKGIELNAENDRGYWKCVLSDDTYYEWNAIPRQKSDFKEGDLISIAYVGNFWVQFSNGPIESYGVIPDICEIILLD